MGEAVKVIRKTVKLHGPRLIQEEIADVQPHVPVDRGTYRREWHFDDVPHGAVVYNSASHAAIIEDGRRPGRMPPVDVIAAWVRRKKLVYLPWRKGRLQQQDIRQAAFRIALAIKKRGLPARHILKFASARLDRVIHAELAKGVAKT